METIIMITLGVVALYVLVSPSVSEFLYRSKIFHPVPFPEHDVAYRVIGGVTGQEVYFHSVNGKLLNGWLYRRADTDKVVLVSHGNSGDITGWVERIGWMLSLGISVFVYDYQGFGKSEGTPSARRICQDGLAAYDYLVDDLGFESDNIVVYGCSMGGAVTSRLIRQRPAAGMIIQSAFTRFHDIAREVSVLGKIFPSWLGVRPGLNNVSNLRKGDVPLLIMHGAADELIGPWHSAQLYLEAGTVAKEFVILPNEQHGEFGSRDTELYVATLKRFLTRIAAIDSDDGETGLVCV